MDDKCKTKVYGRGLTFRGSRCSKPIWKDGYCKTHHPETVKKRPEDSDRKYQEKLANDPVHKMRREIERLNETVAILQARIKELEGLLNE